MSSTLRSLPGNGLGLVFLSAFLFLAGCGGDSSSSYVEDTPDAKTTPDAVSTGVAADPSTAGPFTVAEEE
ncbi:MAG TPA: alpha/beta hydrolase, partial [Alcanivorax sp.]|nr:alpha/beta hydrolase [Alcanivorax sp.]